MAGPSMTHGLRGRCLADRYVLREPIGSGGMASVWLADDTRLGRAVAVKVLAEGISEDWSFLTRFGREARVAASLSHPNLVAVYDFDADAEPPFLVMEYVPGPDLSERMAAGERVDVERLARDLLAALAAIHRAGVLHRDIKPHNVLIAPDGRARLTDFGIARAGDATSLTQTGQVPGTARYMAPELMRGEPASEATDLYSCGVVLRDCLSTEPERGPEAGLAERLCDPDPERRPVSATEALAELDGRRPRRPLPPVETLTGDPETRLMDEASTQTPQPTEPRRAWAPAEPPSRAKRNRMVALGALAVAVAAVVVISTADDGWPGDPRDLRPASGGGAQAGSKQEEEEPAAGAPGPEGDLDPARGAALNDEGFALLQSGEAARAVPVLRRAVASFPEGTQDLNYAFALFNLGSALIDAGRPEDAVPVLRRRLEIPNQRGVVKQELREALEASDG